MFWGLIMEPHKRYTQNISKAFHISMASLDVSNSDDQPSQVLCGFEGRNYLLCTLDKSGILQCPLDLHFEEGTTVSFATNGNSHVHLTGYLTKELDELEEEEIDAEQNEFEVQAQKKSRLNDDSEQPSKKKSKLSEEVEDVDDESDDSDVDLEKLMAMGDEEASEEESNTEEEDDAEEEEDDDIEDEEMEEDEVEDEEELPKVGLMNGLDKKPKKKQNEVQELPKKGKQGKGKQLPEAPPTPGPKGKKQENGDVEKKKAKEQGKKTKENQTPTKRTLSGGLTVEDLKTGAGETAVNGKFVHVYYEGRLKSNNKVFDQTQKGPGFGFRLGKSEVIKGWDIGVSGMKVGGKRRITCPPHLAYGSKGSPPVIPPNATLVFEVELKKVK